MITGLHAILFAKEAEATRSFLGEALGLASVDAGGGWMIYRLPPAEIAAHPAEGPEPPGLYLMCDDIHATVDELERKGAKVLRPIADEGWGLLTTIEIPGGVELGLYEPRHPLPPPYQD